MVRVVVKKKTTMVRGTEVDNAYTKIQNWIVTYLLYKICLIESNAQCEIK